MGTAKKQKKQTGMGIMYLYKNQRGKASDNYYGNERDL